MKIFISTILILCFCLGIYSCSKKDEVDLEESTTTTDNSTTDTTAATLAEVTAVTTPTNDTTPNYTFSTNEAGTITYGGSCSSSTTSAPGPALCSKTHDLPIKFVAVACSSMLA